MAYTLEIVGASTYTFQVQPRFKPRFDYEYDEGRTPPPLVAEIETWLLEGATYVGVDSAVTTNLEDLRAILGNRAAPVTAAKFKRDGNVVRELNTTSHRGGLFMRTLDPTAQAGDGAWATHWSGDLVVYGRRLFADSDGIVKLTKEVSYSYDAAGRATITQRGSVTTVPGTSAEAKAREQTLAQPGAAFGHQTAGPSDEPNVAVTDPDDTSATFESTWREHGISLPAGVNDYVLTVETADVPGEGEVVTTTVRAKGPTPSQLKTAVRGKRPSTALAGAQEAEDKTGVEWSATYTQRRPSVATQDRTGSSKIVYRRYEYSMEGQDEGEDRDDTVDLVPGFAPHFTSNPRGAKVVTERIVSRVRGRWEGIDDFGLQSKARGGDLRPQPGRTSRVGPVLEEQGLTRDADLWRAEVAYVFLARSVDVTGIAELAKAQ